MLRNKIEHMSCESVIICYGMGLRDLKSDIPKALGVSDQGVCQEVWIGLAGAVPLINIEAWRSASAWQHDVTWSLAGRLTLLP